MIKTKRNKYESIDKMLMQQNQIKLKMAIIENRYKINDLKVINIIKLKNIISI